MTINLPDFHIHCNGDVCVGDTIIFIEAVWDGYGKRAKLIGDRTIIGEIVKDSYGKAKQQHTFSIRVIQSLGAQPETPGVVILRKGRTIYRGNPKRKPWKDETKRRHALAEKHTRGDIAREARQRRRATQPTI